MTFRAYIGGPASETQPSPSIDRHLYKEFGDLDAALGFVRHVTRQGGVAFLIEGDDGTRLSKHEIADAIKRFDVNPTSSP